ncbi:MAG: permease [Rhodospirillales bacterium]|nr:permease [Rhodospirillales bacterium]
MWFTEHLPQLQDSLIFFVAVMAEMAILFVGITFLVGVMMDLLPAEKISNLLSAKRGKGYLIGAGLGALTPFCSCSTIPVTKGLLNANAGFGPTMAFLFTSPLVNPMLVALLWMALGLEFTAIYVIVALSLTIGLSYLLDRFGFERFIRADVITSPARSCGAEQSMPVNDTSIRAKARRLFANKLRLKELWRGAVIDYRKFLPFIAVGIAIGAVTHGFVPEDFLVEIAGSDNPWAIPVSAMIGIPLYIRGSVMVPMIMPLAAKGVALGAIAALIIGAAGASIPEVVMLKRMFKLPLMLAFLASVLTIAVVTGYSFEAIMG